MVKRIKTFYHKHKEYALVLFFVGGFIWDSLTLGRIDRWYSNIILFSYLSLLSLSLYIFNRSPDGCWKNTILEPYQDYAPLGVQFFLGGLSSAYVIFFFRSVSFTKTSVFFLLLVFLLFANELLKHHLSNKYFQFGAYFFVNFTFFIFFIPVATGVMSTFIFLISGLIALGITLFFVSYIYWKSPSTRQEVSLKKLSTLIIAIYILLNGFYYFNLIPPVPLALKTGLMAQDVEEIQNSYWVTYKPAQKWELWRTFDHTITYAPGDTIYAFTSIFAPTDLQESVFHRWKWYNSAKDKWVITDKIGYNIKGGRLGGYRGYTYKTNLKPGRWEIDVITKQGLILGTIDFTLIDDTTTVSSKLVRREFR